MRYPHTAYKCKSYSYKFTNPLLFPARQSLDYKKCPDSHVSCPDSYVSTFSLARRSLVRSLYLIVLHSSSSFSDVRFTLEPTNPFKKMGGLLKRVDRPLGPASKGSTGHLIKRELNRRLIYEYRCDGTLKTKAGTTRLAYTGLRGELENLKIQTRLINERLASVEESDQFRFLRPSS